LAREKVENADIGAFDGMMKNLLKPKKLANEPTN
jgi:hypothetical protein